MEDEELEKKLLMIEKEVVIGMEMMIGAVAGPDAVSDYEEMILDGDVTVGVENEEDLVS